MTKEIEIKSKFDALYIDPIALKKIQYWTDAADGEVSGLGIIHQEDGKMIVKEAFILDQECTGVDTELEPEAISKLMTKMCKDGKDPGQLKFWWHSHVSMGVFWSGTDDECAETLSTEYAFSLVVNKSKERRVRLDLYKPFRITVDHVSLIEMTEEDEDLKKKCKDDVKEKVKKKTWNYGSVNGWRKHDRHTRDMCNDYGGYFNREYDDYRDKELIERPKNWGKRIRLPKEDVEDIKKLNEAIISEAYTPDALKSFIKEMMKNSMKSKFKEKASCEGGAGEYWENEKICEECSISKECKTLSEKFGDENEKTNSTKDIEIEENSVEVVIDVDKGEGGNNG